LISARELLRRQAEIERPSLVEGSTGRAITWREVERLVPAWEKAGFGRPVGLMIADPLAMAAHFVAALAAGVTVAPLDPSAPTEETNCRLRDLGIAALVADSMPDGAPVEAWAHGFDGLRPMPGGSGGESPAALPTTAAVIMTSSGTTGRPKIVPLEEAQLLATAGRVAGHLQLGPGEVGYSPLPLFHINGLVVAVLSSLVAGSSMVLEQRFSRSSFWDVVQTRGVTWLNLVPAIIATLSDDRTDATAAVRGPSRVRLARSASAPLAEAVRLRFESLHSIPVIETYGMTEAASQIAANPLGAPRGGSVGRGVGVEVRVVDAQEEPVPSGKSGRVQIRGDSVAGTYWVKEWAGEWSEVPALGMSGWLTTGDIGISDPDGYLHLVGREGDVINRGGEKFQPREVEEILLADSRVRAAVVVGRPHPVLGEEPVAFVLAQGGGRRIEPDRLSAELAERCSRSLSRYKRPVEIHIARSLPAGPTGKIRRAEVRRIAASGSPATTNAASLA
jgi:oxalate---CoA ligase